MVKFSKIFKKLFNLNLISSLFFLNIILDYIVELSKGQRKYRMRPPVNMNNTDQSNESNSMPENAEIFVGKIPKEMFEDELVPLFEKIGKIYHLRLMMDPMTGLSRGYAFITYFKPEHAQLAVEKVSIFNRISFFSFFSIFKNKISYLINF